MSWFQHHLKKKWHNNSKRRHHACYSITFTLSNGSWVSWWAFCCAVAEVLFNHEFREIKIMSVTIKQNVYTSSLPIQIINSYHNFMWLINVHLSPTDYLQRNNIHVTLELTENFTFLSTNILKCGNLYKPLQLKLQKCLKQIIVSELHYTNCI
jgi:hypothetical protein